MHDVPATHLFIKVHEEHNLVFYGGEEVVFVDQLVNIFMLQSQVDLQGSVVPLVICIPAWTLQRRSLVALQTLSIYQTGDGHCNN
jgi:hypothetical protein